MLLIILNKRNGETMKKLILLLTLLSFRTYAMNVTVAGTKASYLQNYHVYNGMGCKGRNSIPEIHWSDLPNEAKYVGVTIYDPDAPTGAGWWHWVILNIPAQKFSHIGVGVYKRVMQQGGLETMTSFGKPGYGGPCPPKGDTPHRYIVTVFAQKDRIELKQSAQPALAGFMLNRHSLMKASATLLYGR